MRLHMQDVIIPTMCFLMAYIFLTTKELLPRSSFDNLGYFMMSMAFLFVGLTLFEQWTKCKDCRLYNNHTLGQCFHERIFIRNDRH